MPSLTIPIQRNGEMERRILSGVSDRVKDSKRRFSLQHEKWIKGEEDAVAYLKVSEAEQLRKNEREITGVPEFTTIKIPYSESVLLTSHSYWTSVFLGRNPVFQFSGRHGETQKQILAMEALIDYQVQVGQMMVPFHIWLSDVGKYGMGVVHNGWREEMNYVSSVQEVRKTIGGVIPTFGMEKKQVIMEVPGYSGNAVANIRPFDWYPDGRYPVRDFQKGEFCAHRVEIGWNQIVKRTKQGYYDPKIVKLLRRADATHIQNRVEGSAAVDLPDPSSYYIKDDKTGKSSNVVSFVEMTIELIPYEWGLGSRTYPEKWVFTVTDDFHFLVGAQPHGAYHCKFDYAVLEYEPTGYTLASRGIPDQLRQLQETVDWLVNSHMYNVRKTLNDKFVFDPSKVEIADILNPQPGGGIRLTPNSYGENIQNAIQQLQITDVTQNNMADLSVILQLGQRVTGVNDQMTGEVRPTGRTSATEVRTGTGFGVNRLKTESEYFSAMGWTPLAQMMVQNSQQYYTDDKMFRIVGQLGMQSGMGAVQVSPDQIAGFYDFISVDGSLPIDRTAQMTLWNQFLGQLANFPGVENHLDIPAILFWIMQLGGIKNLDQFRIQVEPDDMLQQQAQMGNLVPIRPGGGQGPGPAPGTPASQAPPIQVGGGQSGPRPAS